MKYLDVPVSDKKGRGGGREKRIGEKVFKKPTQNKTDSQYGMLYMTVPTSSLSVMMSSKWAWYM